MRGRLKELWKPILQITDGLTIYETLSNFVEEQKNERLSSKQNTLEGHIVKVVTELYNEANVNPIPYIPFQTMWFKLAEDLDGKIDEKKPHVMDTSEFFSVTKNKVGYRLREILSGKSKPVREKGLEGKDTVVKAYVFNREKLRRVAKKYGYEIVTKLLSEPSSEGVGAPKSTLKHHEKNVEKSLDAPQQLGKLSYTVTNPSVQEAVEYALAMMDKRKPDKTTGDIFIHDLQHKDLSKEEAEKQLEKLLDEGILAYDPDGWLVKI